jgi:hypothetical protein
MSTQFFSWNSIAESIVDFGERRLSYPEGLASPCTTCRTAPCCTHLRVQSFKASKLTELDLARYLLNFERIELGLSPEGEWSVYYTYPCRHLDRQDFTCTVHGTPRQPQVCVTYNPFNCWYKSVFTSRSSERSLRVDRQRLEYILAQVVVDDDRNILEMPTWDSLSQGCAQLPLMAPPAASEPPAEDLLTREWQRQVIALDAITLPGDPAAAGVPAAPATRTFASLTDPCHDCQAYCCTHLVFPQPTPQSMSNLDFFRYCLGFPGIELGFGDDGWSLIVASTCRHLVGNRCGVYGLPERPLPCQFYDAWQCSYKPRLSNARPAGYVRLGFDHFDWLAECYQFDSTGQVVHSPGLEEIRGHVETHWHPSHGP